MKDDLRKQLYDNLNLRETEDLLEIWQKKDLDEWREEAFEIIEQILRERLGYVPPLSAQADAKQVLNRVESYMQIGEFDKALSECELAIQMAPDLATAYTFRGLIYDEMGQGEKALADYREALRLDPGSEDAQGYLKSLEREIEEEYLQSSTKHHLDQALDYVLNDEPERALEECELARNAMPEIATAYNYLGMIFEELGQLESAIETYLEAIRINPRFYAARENLANARLKWEEEQYRQASHQDWDETGGKDSSLGDENETTWDFEEIQDTKIQENLDPVPGWVYLDEKGFIMAGWPGHRIRPGRCGYDPLDTDFELGHIEGVMIRWLFTVKFRTHNPVYLLMMACVGILFCLPLLFTGGIYPMDNWRVTFYLILFSPYWIVGFSLWINILASLLIKKPESYEDNGSALF